MFTGIVESTGKIISVHPEGSNRVFLIYSEMISELKVDQSISHNGVCLTVEELDPDMKWYRVSAVRETLDKTNLNLWDEGDRVNLERSVTMEKRLDGHMVQGHVDETIRCIGKEHQEGSHLFTFDLPAHSRHLLIPRGSVTLDGMSLTVARLREDSFSVAIIPFTYENTIAGDWTPGSVINVEYDVFGKYFARYMELMKSAK